MENYQLNWKEYFILGMYAFAGFGLELLLVMAEGVLFNELFGTNTAASNMIHWMLTIILWGGMAMCLINKSKKEQLPVFFRTSMPRKKQWLKAGAAALTAVILTSIVWQGFKPAIEFDRLGPVLFSFQYGYYLLEALLIFLVIVFGQKFGELKWGSAGFPWGGLFLACTWGLIHILLQGPLTGLYTFVHSILMGIIYVSLNRNVKLSYTLIAIIFLI